jgi:DNA invertase Pin-like site-specific DNA recombinase
MERQELAPLKYGPHRDGFILDDGVSGSLLDGRHFSKFLDDLEARKIHPNYLVVYSLSRIARIDRSSKNIDRLKASALAAARIQAVLIGTGVQVLDEDGPMEPSSLTFNLKSMLAAEEYKLIRSRTMGGKARRFREGAFCKGGKPPYGYKQVGEHKTGYRLEPHPDDSRNLLRLLGWYIKGGFTSAARDATQAKIPNPMTDSINRKNKAKGWTPTQWSPVSVMHIIRNVRAYLGETEYIFDGVPYKLTYPPLIDSTLYSKVEARRKERTLKHRATLLSTGFVDCTCGEHIHGKATHTYHLAKCPAGHGSMRREQFESYLWITTVCRLIQIRQHEGVSSSSKNYEGEIKKARRSIDEVNVSISKLLDLYLIDSVDKEELTNRSEVLKQEKAQAQAELDRIVREKEAQASRVSNEQTLEAELKKIIQELVRDHSLTLERKRGILGRLLQGGRLVVRFASSPVVKRKDGGVNQRGQLSPSLVITLPAFGSLPQVDVDTIKDIWPQLLGKKFVGDGYVNSEFIGKANAQEAAEMELLRRLVAVGGKVLSRKVGADGTVVLTKQADKYPW